MGLWNEEKKPAFQWWKRWKQLLSFEFFLQIHQYAIIHSWHREFSLLCPAFNIFFSPFFSINEIELQHSDTYDSMNWCSLVFILPLYFALWMNYNGDQMAARPILSLSTKLDSQEFQVIWLILFPSSILASCCIAKTKLSLFRHLFKFRSVV